MQAFHKQIDGGGDILERFMAKILGIVDRCNCTIRRNPFLFLASAASVHFTPGRLCLHMCVADIDRPPAFISDLLLADSGSSVRNISPLVAKR